MREDLVRRAFYQFDQAGTGRVTLQDFQRVLGDGFDKKDISSMFKETDKKGDGWENEI